MAVSPCFRVKVRAVMVVGSIARLNTALSCLLVTTPMELLPGSVERTVGGVAGATVVKLHV